MNGNVIFWWTLFTLGMSVHQEKKGDNSTATIVLYGTHKFVLYTFGFEM